VKGLAAREGITKRIGTDIGFWDRRVANLCASNTEIVKWAAERDLDGIVWTNLPCGFNGTRGTVPTVVQVIAHLKNLQNLGSVRAEEYVRRAPQQIDTDYRRTITSELGWR
jgi:hypothetical protein